MDKKVLLFFSIFTIVMIGGSFALSLWIFPKIVSNSRYIGFGNSGMIEPSPDIVFTRETMILVSAQMMVTIVIVLLVGRQLIKRINQDRPVSIDGYLYKMSRITGKSEFEIFCKAAEDWPVSDDQIENDFNFFMAFQRTPYYVNHFIRRNQKHLDKLHRPLFIFRQH